MIIYKRSKCEIRSKWVRFDTYMQQKGNRQQRQHQEGCKSSKNPTTIPVIKHHHIPYRHDLMVVSFHYPLWWWLHYLVIQIDWLFDRLDWWWTNEQKSVYYLREVSILYITCLSSSHKLPITTPTWKWQRHTVSHIMLLYRMPLCMLVWGVSLAASTYRCALGNMPPCGTVKLRGSVDQKGGDDWWTANVRRTDGKEMTIWGLLSMFVNWFSKQRKSEKERIYCMDLASSPNNNSSFRKHLYH